MPYFPPCGIRSGGDFELLRARQFEEMEGEIFLPHFKQPQGTFAKGIEEFAVLLLICLYCINIFNTVLD